MQIVQTLTSLVAEMQLADMSASARQVLRRMLMAVVGTGVAVPGEDGIAALRDMLREAGGSGQA